MIEFQKHPRLARANVLGVGVHAVDMAGSIDSIATAIEYGRKAYVCLCSVHGIMEAQRDPEFANILDRAMLTAPDGMPLVWLGRLQGFTAMRRVFGPDLMQEVVSFSLYRRWTHFLYGGAPGLGRDLSRVLQTRFPGVRIVGTYEPPFRPLLDEEKADLVRRVQQATPDIIWVGLSTPKQEHFMAEYLPRLDCRIMIGVGAAFDYHTGRLKDSPAWVKQCGMQWAHRLLQEPSRLWRRYLRNNPAFLYRVALQIAGLKSYAFSESCSEFSELPDPATPNKAA